MSRPRQGQGHAQKILRGSLVRLATMQQLNKAQGQLTAARDDSGEGAFAKVQKDQSRVSELLMGWLHMPL